MKHPKQYDTTKETSKRMSMVKLKNSIPERLIANRLWHLGYRYRKNYKLLPGSPDIAILKHRVAVFIDGEFWHGKDWDNRKEKLKRNREYWLEKIAENMDRDVRVDRQLKEIGWTPIRFWARDATKNTDACISAIIRLINENQV